MKPLALPFRYGLATSGALIAWFLILSLFGLHTRVPYSIFNAVITGFGIYKAIRATRNDPGRDFTYSRGFVAGLVTGFVATLVFTVFFAVYSTEIDRGFLPRLSTTFFRDFRNFQAIVFFTVAIMGFATTLVLTLAFMQRFKKSNTPSKKTS